MRSIDENHIRRELVRLSKMARDLRMKELAHFIDVAGEVASEMAATLLFHIDEIGLRAISSGQRSARG
jgi:hypothetical protein